MNKILLMIFFFFLPFDFPETAAGLTVVSFCTVVAFIYFGMEYVGISIEVPFGEDDMDINMLRFLRFFECESTTMMELVEEKLKAGRQDDKWPKPRSHFTWMLAPQDYS